MEMIPGSGYRSLEKPTPEPDKMKGVGFPGFREGTLGGSERIEEPEKIVETLIDFLGGRDELELHEGIIDPNDGMRPLPPDFWFRVITKIYERFGEEPNPMQIRAHAIVRALGIPSGQVSALTSTEAAVRTDPKTDEIIAERLTNRAGVEILPEHISSSDILDLYPDGLPEELKQHLDSRIVEMFEARYEYFELLNRQPDAGDPFKLDSEHYFRMPGGIDLVSVGYTHHRRYQEIHGDYLERISKKANVIVIEGFKNISYGTSLKEYMSSSKRFSDVYGHYDTLMHRLSEAGFQGLFSEVDARDISRIDLRKKFSEHDFFLYPRNFIREYREYLNREHPGFARGLHSDFHLLELLNRQSDEESDGFGVGISVGQREYLRTSGVDVLEKGAAAYPTGLEIGQMIFSDAISAIKLHLIARLMADGKIDRGPILTIRGSMHLSNETFFLRYPEYAMEIVLRNLPELMAFRAKFKTISLSRELKDPDWPEVVRQVAKLAFAKTTDDPERIEPFFYDYLGEYGIDPERVIPSDREIKEIMEKTERGSAIRKADKKKIDREE